ncbi:hypothetical protein VTI74DRAFT_4811 [Chaetomium olivicolor]
MRPNPARAYKNRECSELHCRTHPGGSRALLPGKKTGSRLSIRVPAKHRRLSEAVVQKGKSAAKSATVTAPDPTLTPTNCPHRCRLTTRQPGPARHMSGKVYSESSAAFLEDSHETIIQGSSGSYSQWERPDVILSASPLVLPLSPIPGLMRSRRRLASRSSAAYIVWVAGSCMRSDISLTRSRHETTSTRKLVNTSSLRKLSLFMSLFNRPTVPPSIKEPTQRYLTVTPPVPILQQTPSW